MQCALALVFVLACVELPDTARRAGTEPSLAQEPSGRSRPPPALRIGTWNVRKLGFEEGKDIAAIARLIEAHFDLIGLVEIMWTEDDAAFRALIEQLGPGWQVQRTSTPRPNVSSPHAEHYAVANRTAAVGPCAELPTLERVPDGDGSSGSPERGIFLREPAFGCYRARAEGADNDFVFAVYHAEWGDGSAAAIAEEVAHIDAVFSTMHERFPAEEQLFIVGDFNLGRKQLAPLTAATDRTEGRGSTLAESGAISEHLYDHLLAYGEASNQALLAGAEVLDVRSEAFDPKLFRRTLSDHLPLVAQLRCGMDDD